MTHEQKLRKVIRSLIKEELKNLKYDEPSLHKNEDAPYGKPDPSKYLAPEGVMHPKFSSDRYEIDPKYRSKFGTIIHKLKNKKGIVDVSYSEGLIHAENGFDLSKYLTPNEMKMIKPLDETSSVGAMGGGDSYQTPFAFSKPGADPKKKRALKNNKWKVVESTRNPNSWEKFLLAMEAVPEQIVDMELFEKTKQEYMDTPGYYHSEGKGRGEIIPYMKRNMGKEDFENLKRFYKKYQSLCDRFSKKHQKDVDKFYE